MKKLAIITVLAGVLAGCGKNDSTSNQAAEDTKKAGDSATSALGKTVDSAKAEGAKAVESAKAEGTKTVAAAKEQAKEATAGVQAKAQEWIDKAKTLVGEQKFQEAGAALQNLAGLTLTADQQKAVDTLKEQIQKAFAASKDGASAVNSLLKK